MASNTRTRASNLAPRPRSSPKWIVTGAILAGVVAAQSPWGIVPPTDTTLFLLATGALWAGWYLYRGASQVQGRGPWRLMIAVTALAGTAAASALLSPHWYTGLLGAPARSMGLAMWISLAGLAIWAAFNAGGLRSALMLAAPVLLGTEMLAAVFQQLQGGEAIGTLSNSTFLGQVAVVLLPPSVALLWRRGGGWRDSGIVLAATTALLMFWFGSGAAAAIAALFAGVLLWMRFGPETMSAPPLPGTKRLAAVLVAVGAILLTLPVLAARFVSSEGWFFDRLTSRPYLWDAGLELFGRSPLIGTGPDSYRVAAAAVVPDAITIAEGYQTRSFGSLAADPHNLMVLLAVELGVVGVVGVLWLALEVTRNWVRQTEAGQSDHGWFAWSTLLGVATFALAPLGLQSALPLALVLGASLRPELPNPPVPRRLSASTTLKVMGVLVLVSSALVGAHSGARIWVQSSSERLEVAKRASSAADLASGDAFMSFWEARSWAALGTDAADAKALAAAAEATDRDPENPFYLTDRAFFLGAYANDMTATIEAYAAAEALYPASLDIPLYRGRFLLGEGNLDAAAIDVKRALYLGASDPSVQSLSAEYERVKVSQ